MNFKKFFAAFIAAVIVVAALSMTAFALWVDDKKNKKGNRTFQCSNGGALEVRFFGVDGLQKNFYELNGDFFVDDADLKDEYLEKGMTDAGDFLLVFEETVSVLYEMQKFDRFELTVKPVPGFIFEKFVDASCNCGQSFDLIDGAYHLTPYAADTIMAVFEEDIYWFDIAEGIAPDLNMVVNGEAINTDVPPFIENDRTMVPIRFISEALGAEVAWDSGTRTVTVTAVDGRTIQLIIGGTSLTVTQNEWSNDVQMDASAVLRDNRTYIPVRFVAEALGLRVEWDKITRTVSFFSYLAS